MKPANNKECQITAISSAYTYNFCVKVLREEFVGRLVKVISKNFSEQGYNINRPPLTGLTFRVDGVCLDDRGVSLYLDRNHTTAPINAKDVEFC
jgi:hypothetical protein